MTATPANTMLAALANVRAFILYRKSDKHPVNAEGNAIDAQDRSLWMTPELALSWVAILGPEYGIGIVLHPELKIFCLDIDKAHNVAWSELATRLYERFKGCAAEVSLSGKGLHIFGSYSGDMPPHAKRNTALNIELYHELRYIALTGTNLEGNVRHDCTSLLPSLIAEYFPPSETNRDDIQWTTKPVSQWSGPDDDKELVAMAKRSRSATAIFGDGASFTDLYTGNPDKLQRAYPPQSPGEAWDASAADMALANMLAFWTGGNAERMETLMRESALHRPKHDRPDYMRKTVLKACALAAKGAKYYNDGKKAPVSSDDPREAIILRGGQFDKYAAQCERLLVDDIYVHGHRLVRIGRAAEISPPLDNIVTRRDAEQAVCIPASAGWLRRALMERATFWKYDKRAGRLESHDCPKEITENIIDQEAWTTFRSLVAISPVPVLRPDMSVWSERGYDAMTGVYHQPSMNVPDIPSSPTRDDALQALQRLYEPFNQFPLASPAAAAVFVSHVISAVLRQSYDTSPIFAYVSPIPGTGKTLLAGIANRIANGAEPALSPYSEGDELRKVLFSSLLAGDSAIVLDNIPNGLKVRAPGLCVFATSPTYSDRVLGVSETRKVPNRCTVILTGNNITPVGDLARRSLVCRLDANAESARGRTFRIADLRGYVRQQRAQLIVDVLTIVRAYAFAGRPTVAAPLESFEYWSRLVRDPLVWLGMADPVASQESDTDDELAPLQAAFTAIAQVAKDSFTSSQIAALTVMPQHAAIREALTAAGCGEPTEARKVGYWLREQRDKVAAGWKLVIDRPVHGVTSWRLQSTRAG